VECACDLECSFGRFNLFQISLSNFNYARDFWFLMHRYLEYCSPLLIWHIRLVSRTSKNNVQRTSFGALSLYMRMSFPLHFANLFQNQSGRLAFFLLGSGCSPGTVESLTSRDLISWENNRLCSLSKRLHRQTRDYADKKEPTRTNKNLCGKIAYNKNKRNVESAFD
jgi:hypothetical protein